ncbi:MAG: NAD(P)-dependent alcohol dehydrogenase [Armatimonadetes bacterium]|nr:NAD(P)-dependent alcohol dehydrogenase [Armatimonadota bacterium]
MRCLRLHSPLDLRMHEEPEPRPGPGEVQIRIMSVGVCASDVHWYRDGRIGSTVISDPIVLGHEASGVISALGEGVRGLAVGDRVAIEPAKPCMECESCKAGHYNVCPGIPFFGTPPTDGCFRDYVTWPASLALRIPDSVSFDDAAMVEPLAVGVYAVELAELKPEDTVVVLGAGAIGLSTVQAAKVAGARRIIVSEPIAARRELAIKLGACDAIDPLASDAVEEVKRLTGGRGADAVFECAGDSEAVLQSSRMARVLGKVMIIGIPDDDTYQFDASASRRKQLTAIFVRRSNLTTEKSIEMVAEGKVDVKSYATHHFSLEDAGKALELAATKGDGLVRAVVVVSD